MRTKSEIFTEKATLAASLFFWFLIYGFSRHPDVTWGDGIGYALAIRNGFDLSINANSHFLYLNFHRLLMILTGVDNPMLLLSWASVGWSLAALYVVFLVGKVLFSRQIGVLALHFLAVSFPFWRQASIIEVYAMELFFWLVVVYGLVCWFQSDQEKYLWLMLLTHAVGLLVHIHMVLFFPVLAFALVQKRTFRTPWLVPYIIPVLTMSFLVFFLKINTLGEVFFDSIQGTMLRFRVWLMLKGVGMVALLLVAMFPLGFVLLAMRLHNVIPSIRRLAHNHLYQVLFALGFILLGFCFPYPSFGIYVFLLPVFALLAICSARLAKLSFRGGLGWKVFAILSVQLALYAAGYVFFPLVLPEANRAALENRGGAGYYFLPWARANAPSILEATRNGSVPPDLDWNRKQAELWLHADSLNP